MGNCLVTKLKAVVDNDNLVKLGWMRIRNAVKDNEGIRNDALLISVEGTFADNVIMHNATQQNYIVSWTNREAWCDVKKETLYSLYNYGLNRNSFKINVEDLTGCSILSRLTATGVSTTEQSSYGSIDNIIDSLNSMARFEIGNNPLITGSISRFLTLTPSLTWLSIQNTGIGGSADCFVNNGSLIMPLTHLEIGGYASTNSPCNVSVSTIVICANNGCKFYAHENQIVWDTMTKDEFKAAYQSYPTPPEISWKS